MYKKNANTSLRSIIIKDGEAITFDDVLIRPKYTEVLSRSDPKTEIEVAGFSLTSPIVSSPMDTVTEHLMAIQLSEIGAMGIVHRFMPSEEQVNQINLIKEHEDKCGLHVKKIFAIGVGDDEWIRAEALINAGVDGLAIDVANGHSSYTREMILKIKNRNPDIKIIAGNVATGEGFGFLANCGADAVRVGIGGGCFTPETRVMTKEGYKKIEDISIGDSVITHTGAWKQVIDTMKFYRDESIVSINDIECTKNHEFYVVNKCDENFLTEDNIHNHAFWIEADHLDESKHFLIELDC